MKSPLPFSGKISRRFALAAVVATLALASSLNAAVLYSTGFEPPTFTTGPIAGQDGWSVYGTSAAAQVENTFRLGGTQAVSVIPAVTTGQTGPYKTITTAAPIVQQSADIYLASSSVQTSWQFAALGAGLVGYAGGINISRTGAITAITAGMPVIATITRDTWNNIVLTLNYATQTYSIAMNGVMLAVNVAFCGDNGPCTGAVVPAYSNGFFDSFAAIPGENDIGYMDNYSVSTPSAAPEQDRRSCCFSSGLPRW